MEIVGLKKENRELRSKFRKLNGRLTRLVENMKVQAVRETLKDENRPFTDEDVFEKEMANMDTQMESYNKEITFLKERLEKGGQIERIHELEGEVRELTTKETALQKMLSKLKNEAVIIANTFKRLAQPENHDAKISAMIEKRKVYTIKEHKLEDEQIQVEKLIENQARLAKAMNERYIALCTNLNLDPEVIVTFDADNRANIRLLGDLKDRARTAKAKSTPFLRKSIDQYMSEAWTNDNPQTYKDPTNEKEFDKLKGKVKALMHSVRIDEKRVQLKKKQEVKTIIELETKRTKLGT